MTMRAKRYHSRPDRTRPKVVGDGDDVYTVRVPIRPPARGDDRRRAIDEQLAVAR